MGKRSRALLLLALLAMCYAAAIVSGYREGGGGSRRETEEEAEERRRGRREREEEMEEEGGRRERGRREGEEMFLLQDEKRVVKTDAGEMKVVKGFGGRFFLEKPMHVGFITMEPQTLFIPQYLDSTLIIFVRRGEARVGTIDRDRFVEKSLKGGDLYRIAAGSAFYLVNTAEGQRLHIICSIDKTESLEWDNIQSFFIGGGTYPKSILAGFDPVTLSTAFNVSVSELRSIMSRQAAGPIVYLSGSRLPHIWTQFLQLKQNEKMHHMKRMVQFHEEATSEEEDQPTWSWRKLLMSMLAGKEGKEKDSWRSKAPDSYNIYQRRPDFKNKYGWSLALDKSEYSPLGQSDFGVYLVNLTAGSMMAPHVNPRATEYGIVLRGSGTIQVVFPNGTSAMNAKVNEGDVFWVPRYFPFCQIASHTGPFEFFGFTTSAHNNRPQFLVGASSVLQTMRGPELAAAFGVTEERFEEIIDAQREAVILPSAPAAPPDKVRREEEMKLTAKHERLPSMMRSFGEEMVMGFD